MNPISDPTSAIWQQPGTVAKFLENVRQSAPLAIEQIDIMLRLISAARERIETFLIIGSEDSVLAAAMLDEFHGARGLLLDTSVPLLDTARNRLRLHGQRIECRASDFSSAEWVGTTASFAPFDAVICGFTTSNLPDERKRAMYAEIYSLLKPGGIFLNLEVVASATRWSESAMENFIVDAIFGDEMKTADHKTPAEIAREYYRHAGKDAPRLAPLEVQCDWLREIGYESVDCYLKVLELAVFGGQRPE